MYTPNIRIRKVYSTMTNQELNKERKILNKELNDADWLVNTAYAGIVEDAEFIENKYYWTLNDLKEVIIEIKKRIRKGKWIRGGF